MPQLGSADYMHRNTIIQQRTPYAANNIRAGFRWLAVRTGTERDIFVEWHGYERKDRGAGEERAREPDGFPAPSGREQKPSGPTSDAFDGLLGSCRTISFR